MGAKPDDATCKLVHHHQKPSVLSNLADAHRSKSQLHKLSLVWPRKMSQDGPPESAFGR